MEPVAVTLTQSSDRPQLRHLEGLRPARRPLRPVVEEPPAEAEAAGLVMEAVPPLPLLGVVLPVAGHGADLAMQL